MKYSHKRIKINKLKLPNYLKWLHQNYSGDCHHIFTKGRHGHWDNLIVMVTREEHMSCHHQIGIDAWVEKEGGYEILVPRALDYFRDYLTSGGCNGFEFVNYYELVSEIENDPLNAVEVTRTHLMEMEK